MSTLTKEDLLITKEVLENNASANVKYARAQLKLTQEKFAKALQVSRQVIGAIEENRSAPSPHLIYRLSLLINVSISTLYLTELNNQNQEWNITEK
jgi:putative transcriptional regulator